MQTLYYIMTIVETVIIAFFILLIIAIAHQSVESCNNIQSISDRLDKIEQQLSINK